MNDIKPKMVDGEAYCTPGCQRFSEYHKDCHAIDIHMLCAPYYKARVAELEASQAIITKNWDIKRVERCELEVKATLARAETAEAKNEKLKKEIEFRVGQIEFLIEDSDELLSRVERLEKKLQDCPDEYEDVCEWAKSLVADSSDYYHNYEKIMDQRDEERELVKDLEFALAKATGRIEELKFDLIKMTNQRDRSEKAGIDLGSDVALLRVENERIRGENVRIFEENENLKNVIEGIQSELEEYEDYQCIEVSFIRYHLEALEAACEDIKGLEEPKFKEVKIKSREQVHDAEVPVDKVDLSLYGELIYQCPDCDKGEVFQEREYCQKCGCARAVLNKSQETKNEREK